MICQYCGKEFNKRQWNQIHCKSPECEQVHMNAYWKKNHHKWPTHNPKPRVCLCCGRDITRTRWQRYCGLPECRRAMAQEWQAERMKPQPEPVTTGKSRYCRYPKCKEPTGANYFYCHRNAKLLERCYSDDAIGFWDGPADMFL